MLTDRLAVNCPGQFVSWNHPSRLFWPYVRWFRSQVVDFPDPGSLTPKHNWCDLVI